MEFNIGRFRLQGAQLNACVAGVSPSMTNERNPVESSPARRPSASASAPAPQKKLAEELAFKERDSVTGTENWSGRELRC